jgi:O-antigen ligase
MTISSNYTPAYQSPQGVDASLALLGHIGVWLVVFSSFFVLFEPAPYEVLCAGLIGAGFLFGLTLSRPILPLLVLLAVYLIGGFIGAMLSFNLSDAKFDMFVKTFLATSSIFFACYVIKDCIPRINLITSAWQLGAVFAALLGIMGYFNVGGTAEMFTLYGRARGSFQDPNVFGPFLTGAALFAYYKLLYLPVSRWAVPAAVLAICLLGILLSFSRGTWGLTIITLSVVTVLHFALTPHPAERLRIIWICIAGFMVALVGLMVALSTPAIADLLLQRANVLQSYDSGPQGRFGMQGIALQMAIVSPIGIGIGEFARMYGIEPHNVYLTALLVHGWAGFFAYTSLIVITLLQMLKIILSNPQYRIVAIPLFAMLLGLALMGTFIETDRWRHFFMLLGMCWGVIGASVLSAHKGHRHAALQV